MCLVWISVIILVGVHCLEFVFHFLLQIWEVFSHYFFQISSLHLPVTSPPETYIMHILIYFMVYHNSLSLFHFYFFLLVPLTQTSNYLSSSLPILSSTWSSLLLNLCTFFNSIILFFISRISFLFFFKFFLYFTSLCWYILILFLHCFPDFIYLSLFFFFPCLCSFSWLSIF